MDKKDNNNKDKGATPKSKKCAAKPQKQKEKMSNLLSSLPCDTPVQNLAPHSASHIVAKLPVSGASVGEMEVKIYRLEKMLLTQKQAASFVPAYGGFYYG